MRCRIGPVSCRDETPLDDVPNDASHQLRLAPYAQAPRKDTPYPLPHGTLAAEALSPTTTRSSYTMVRDDSMLADDAARQKDIAARHAHLAEWPKNMKVLAEGGKLPPKPPGNRRPPVATPFLNPDPH